MPSSRRLLVDTNLLVVLVVGAVEPEHIGRFSRTQEYSADDFLLLDHYIATYRLVVTPNVLTETSNFLGYLKEPYRTRAFAVLTALMGEMDERYFPSRDLATDPHFARLGLTDVSILRCGGEAVAVLTADFELYNRLATIGAEVYNYNHIRSAAWEVG